VIFVRIKSIAIFSFQVDLSRRDREGSRFAIFLDFGGSLSERVDERDEFRRIGSE
jgi:hypothetical protein